MFPSDGGRGAASNNWKAVPCSSGVSIGVQFLEKTTMMSDLRKTSTTREQLCANWSSSRWMRDMLVALMAVRLDARDALASEASATCGEFEPLFFISAAARRESGRGDVGGRRSRAVCRTGGCAPAAQGPTPSRIALCERAHTAHLATPRLSSQGRTVTLASAAISASLRAKP